MIAVTHSMTHNRSCSPWGSILENTNRESGIRHSITASIASRLVGGGRVMTGETEGEEEEEHSAVDRRTER